MGTIVNGDKEKRRLDTRMTAAGGQFNMIKLVLNEAMLGGNLSTIRTGEAVRRVMGRTHDYGYEMSVELANIRNLTTDQTERNRKLKSGLLENNIQLHSRYMAPSSKTLISDQMLRSTKASSEKTKRKMPVMSAERLSDKIMVSPVETLESPTVISNRIDSHGQLTSNVKMNSKSVTSPGVSTSILTLPGMTVNDRILLQTETFSEEMISADAIIFGDGLSSGKSIQRNSTWRAFSRETVRNRTAFSGKTLRTENKVSREMTVADRLLSENRPKNNSVVSREIPSIKKMIHQHTTANRKMASAEIATENTLAITTGHSNIRRKHISEETLSRTVSAQERPLNSTASIPLQETYLPAKNTSTQSFPVVESRNTKNNWLTTDEEIKSIFATTETQLLATHNILANHISDCLKRNGSVHIRSMLLKSVMVFDQTYDTRRGQDMFCLVRWTIVGNVGVLVKILLKDCSATAVKAFLYELDSTVPHRPQIRLMCSVCEGIIKKSYYGHTNELLVFLTVKNSDYISKFFLEMTRRSLDTLKIHFSSDEEGWKILLF